MFSSRIDSSRLRSESTRSESTHSESTHLSWPTESSLNPSSPPSSCITYMSLSSSSPRSSRLTSSSVISSTLISATLDSSPSMCSDFSRQFRHSYIQVDSRDYHARKCSTPHPITSKPIGYVVLHLDAEGLHQSHLWTQSASSTSICLKQRASVKLAAIFPLVRHSFIRFGYLWNLVDRSLHI